MKLKAKTQCTCVTRRLALAEQSCCLISASASAGRTDTTEPQTAVDSRRRCHQTNDKIVIQGLKLHGWPRLSSNQIEFNTPSKKSKTIPYHKMNGLGAYPDTTLGIQYSVSSMVVLRPMNHPPLPYLSATNSQSLSYTNNYSLSPSCLTLTLPLPRPLTNPPTSN